MDTLFTYNEILEYVEEIYNVMLDAGDEKLNAACDALVKMTPAPMNTMLEKQPKEDAIQKDNPTQRESCCQCSTYW